MRIKNHMLITENIHAYIFLKQEYISFTIK